MFDRFTDSSRKVMGFAREEALRRSPSVIGTGELLVALTRTEGAARTALDRLRITEEGTRAGVDERTLDGPQPPGSQGDACPFAPRAKRVLESADEEAALLRHNFVGTEHLLLGLAREHDSPAADILAELLGMDDPERACARVADLVYELLGADHEDLEERKSWSPAVKRRIDALDEALEKVRGAVILGGRITQIVACKDDLFVLTANGRLFWAVATDLVNDSSLSDEDTRRNEQWTELRLPGEAS